MLDEAERNAGFRRQVKAALAGKSGPVAIAKLVDRRLSGLARARSFIEWDKARAFADDLRSLTDTLASELGAAAPALAVDRLLRFIATHEQVFERVDESSGRVQDIYCQAVAATGDLARRLTPAEADHLPEKIMTALGENTHGHLADVTTAVAPHLPQDSLARWDADLKEVIAERQAEEALRVPDCWFYSMTSQWVEMRQTIARARGDLDLLVALEAGKRPHMQDTLGIAAQLLEAGRSAEALDWVRKPGGARLLRTRGICPRRGAAWRRAFWRPWATHLPRRPCAGSVLRPRCPPRSCGTTSANCRVSRISRRRTAPTCITTCLTTCLIRRSHAGRGSGCRTAPAME
ncbi:hypothetical protein KUV64_05925 [Mameliella alba]|nr:DUF6880 family protein [Mameliella alba]MBY6118661.1 hypothetical protein [Mameliella alba]